MNEPDYEKLINSLIKARKKQHISQHELDDMIGTSSGQVAKWEVGARKPRAFLLTCWANALGGHIKFYSNEKK